MTSAEPRRLILSHALPSAGMDVLAGRPDIQVDILVSSTQQELLARIGSADGLMLVMERPALDAATIAHGGRLRVVCRAGAGFDNVDVAALTTRGIPLVTAGDANADTVAEHAVYLLLAVAKRGPIRDRAVRRGEWPREFGAVELRGQTCLVIGYGEIGRRVARLAGAFGMKVQVSDPYAAQRIAGDGFGPVSLDEALSAADALILACALSAETRGLLHADRIALMKPSAIVVNVSPGPVID